jgi:hypothetical protein
MGMNDLNPDFECTPLEYWARVDALWDAIGVTKDRAGKDVFAFAIKAIEDAQQKPSRRQIAAMAMQGLLSNPGFREDVVHGRIAKMAIDEADNLIYHLNADPVAEGVNLLPMYSRGLDEGLDNDQDRGVSR